MTHLSETMVWVPGFIAFALGLTLPMSVRPLLHRWNLVDIPTARSSHTQPTYRGMGLATALAALIAYAVGLLSGLVHTDRSIALTVLVGMIASGALGWAEDYRGVSIKKRFAAQLAIGFAVTVALTIFLQTTFWWIPVGILAIAAFINVVNFMDGVNGISGINGFVIGAFYAYAGWTNAMPWLIVGGVSVACAYLAFLPWNIRSGKNVFLGDAGSYFLGGAIASMAVGAFLSGVYVEYLLSPVLIYLADTGFTLFRRMVRGEQWYKPHRTHVYQRLTDVGFSHLGAALTTAAFSVAITVITIVALPYQTQNALIAGALVIALLTIYLLLPRIIVTFKGRHGRK